MVHRLKSFAIFALLLGIATVGIIIVHGVAHADAGTAGSAPPTSVANGRTIWLRDCAVCHTPDASGSSRGPDIRGDGIAAVDFMVATGRMPLSDPKQHVERRPVHYSKAQISALVGYASTLVHGTAIPEPNLSAANLGDGGAAFRTQCAACHQAAGGGGALAYGAAAPALSKATPTQVIEAMRVGPGNMPVFSPRTVSPQQANEIAAYVRYLQHARDPGGANLGHLGPVPEGLIAWTVGLVSLLLIVRFLGTRLPSRH